MTLRSTIPFALLLAAVARAQPNFEFPQFESNFLDGTNNLIPEWLPQCFNGVEGGADFDPFGVVNCVQENSLPSCMDGKTLQETLGEVAECISTSVSDQVASLFEGLEGQPEVEEAVAKQGDNGNPVEDFLSNLIGEEAEGLFNIAQVFVNSTRTCLDPFADCVNATIQQAMNNLDPCINSTLTELVQCGQDNSEICLESCNGTRPTENPFGGLIGTQVTTCPQIQANLMNPLCDMVGCCEPCVPKVEALMQCLVNDQLDNVPATGNSCDNLACPAASERRRLAAPSRQLETTSAAGNAPEDCLQYAPGLTGDDGAELSARSAIFLPCATDSFLKATATPTESHDPSGEEQEHTAEDSNEQAQNDEDASAAGHASAALTMIGVAASFLAMSN